MQKVFYGKEQKQWNVADFGIREMGIMASLAVAIIWLGLFPAAALKLASSAVVSIAGGKNKTTEAKTRTGSNKYPVTGHGVFSITVAGKSLPGKQTNLSTQIKDDRTGY